MSSATAWPGFAPVTDPRQIDRQTAQLADHFETGPLAGGERLSGEQVAEYNRLTLAQAQRHGERADALERHATAHRARGERLAEEARPTELVLDLTGAHPTLTEQKAAIVPPADERVDLAEAAVRARMDVGMVLVSLGVPPEDGYLVADVDRLAQDR